MAVREARPASDRRRAVITGQYGRSARDARASQVRHGARQARRGRSARAWESPRAGWSPRDLAVSTTLPGPGLACGIHESSEYCGISCGGGIEAGPNQARGVRRRKRRRSRLQSAAAAICAPDVILATREVARQRSCASRRHPAQAKTTSGREYPPAFCFGPLAGRSCRPRGSGVASSCQSCRRSRDQSSAATAALGAFQQRRRGRCAMPGRAEKPGRGGARQRLRPIREPAAAPLPALCLRNQWRPAMHPSGGRLRRRLRTAWAGRAPKQV